MLFATRITRSLPYTKINLSLSVLSQAIHEIISKIAIKTRGIGGSTHQVPVERRSTQWKVFVIRWLLWTSQKHHVEMWLSN